MPCPSGLRLNYSMSCPTSEVSHVSAPTTTLDVQKITEWLRKYDQIFPRFERISNNGLHSSLQKEAKAMSSLIEEGQAMEKSTSHLTLLLNMVDELVKPRLKNLQTAYVAANAKLGADAERLSLDAKMESKWKKFGLPMSIVENHADCVRFLMDSGLIFTILGFRETCQDPNIHDIKLDHDGHPLIKMKGRFVRWETLARELEFDPKTGAVKSRNYPGSLAQTWNYFHPEGLVDRDRYTYDKPYSVYELTPAENAELITLAKKFYENNPERDPGVTKDCVVQFFTAPRIRKGLPDHPLLENLHRNDFVHMSMRLIKEGKVYSFGLELPPEEANFVLSDLSSTFLATADAKISMLDYEEFRDHPKGMWVTSVPLSSQRAQNILSLVENLSHEQLRFNFLKQNCSALMHQVLQCAGYEVDIRTTGKAVLWEALPSLNQLPVIGGVVGKVEQCAQRVWDALPACFTTALTFTRNVVMYIPDKIGTILTHLLIYKLGGAKKMTPLKDGVPEDEFYDKKGFHNFSSVIRSWTDFFKDETSAVNHSKYFIDWQKQQASTFHEPKGTLPRMAILPRRTA